MALCTYISPLPGGLRARQAPPRPSQRCMLSCGPCSCPAVVVWCRQGWHDVPSATSVCCPIAPLCCCWARLGCRAPAGTSAPPKRALRLLDPQSISNPPYASDRRRTRGQVMACRAEGKPCATKKQREQAQAGVPTEEQSIGAAWLPARPPGWPPLAARPYFLCADARCVGVVCVVWALYASIAAYTAVEMLCHWYTALLLTTNRCWQIVCSPPAACHRLHAPSSSVIVSSCS
jgi:hypothetical protein